MKGRKKDQIRSKDYFSLSQYRLDCWGRVRDITESNSKRNLKKVQWTELGKYLKILELIESYFAFPGKEQLKKISDHYEKKELKPLEKEISKISRSLVSEDFRTQPESFLPEFSQSQRPSKKEKEGESKPAVSGNYFEVLLVDEIGEKEEKKFKKGLNAVLGSADGFFYRVVVARSYQDALITLLFNAHIQSVVIRHGVPFKSRKNLSELRPFLSGVKKFDPGKGTDEEIGLNLGKVIRLFRPELDLFYVTERSVSDLQKDITRTFNRVFYRREDFQELHLSIIRAIKSRYQTPFFSALVDYSQKPTGVFHAMPISRGNSVFKSRWIQDFSDFYGRNIFLAETSATTGGLDSLLQPTGTLKKAQELAAKAYGSQKTFFVTNGTSTANKIVLQALVQPGDLVLIDRDCHKSHHYGLVLSGAFPVYLDSYPVPEYSMYGAVTLNQILSKLNELKKAGRLDKVKMLLLTNCTFDGLVYNVEKVMEAVLAIKPDMIFLWDEAWYAFSRFTYTYLQRTAMFVAKKLAKKYASEKYRESFERLKKARRGKAPLLPDPEKVKIRVFATQSTHKTLSSLRQGSMIHIYDQEFNKGGEEAFHEAYMTHTSTSPNYQILASLDVGRRQVQFEGYELVEKSIEMAMVLRSKIHSNASLRKYFDVLTVKDFIPEKYRSSGITEYFNTRSGWSRMEQAWIEDEFVLDPTKINLHIGRTGVDGDTFKNKYLMDKFGIQINKTSRNTVLFMTNIGTTRSSVAYLLGVLEKIAEELDSDFESLNREEKKRKQEKVVSLTEDYPPLPDFSHFHSSFQAVPGVPGGNIRGAYFLAYHEDNCDYLSLEECLKHIRSKKDVVSANFVIPYPPGFPVLVPGQVASKGIIEFLRKLDVKEIHGYNAEIGLRVFNDKVLSRQRTGTSIIGTAIRRSSASR